MIGIHEALEGGLVIVAGSRMEYQGWWIKDRKRARESLEIYQKNLYQEALNEHKDFKVEVRI
jgi:hypothetical protein